MVRSGQVFQPSPESVGAYHPVREHYRQLYGFTDPLFEHLDH